MYCYVLDEIYSPYTTKLLKTTPFISAYIFVLYIDQLSLNFEKQFEIKTFKILNQLNIHDAICRLK